MTTPLALRYPLLLVLLIGATVPGRAQDAVLVLDHASGTLHLREGGRNRPVAPGATIAVRDSTVELRIERTRTPFYTYGSTAAAPTYPDREALFAFLGKLGGYSVDLLTTQVRLPAAAPLSMYTVRPRAEAMMDAPSNPLLLLRERAEAVREGIGQTQLLLYRGTETLPSLQRLQLRTLETLHRMADRDPDADVDGQARALWAEMRPALSGDAPSDSTRIQHVARLLDTYRTLDADAAMLYRLAAGLKQSGDLPKYEDSLAVARLKEADAVLADAPAQFGRALSTERLARRALRASSIWNAPTPIRLATGASRKLTLVVERDPATGQAADMKPLTIEVTLERRWPIRPSFGLSLLYARQAVYPSSFATQSVDGGFEVVAAADQDNRFQWAATLTLTSEALQAGRVGFAPQFHINPTDGVKAIGMGGALSVGLFEVSAGALWTKHAVLDGRELGQVLAAQETPRTRQTYGAPRFYVGLSLRGIPPFTSK